MKYRTLLLLLPLNLCLCAQGTVVSVEQQPTTTATLLGALLPIAAEYDVANYKITYTTTDPFGQPDTATGLLSVPVQSDLVFPLAVYNHGTVQTRDGAPSVLGTPERLLVAGLATSRFITLAPDYLGLGGGNGIHPYLHAATQASAGRDMILAVQTWLDERDIRYSEQLFITGYSQGGHASLSLQRDIEQNPGDDGLVVTAAAHLSGPYFIAAPTPQQLALPSVEPNLLSFFLNTAISYNYVNNLYGPVEDFIREPYLSVVQRYLADEIPLLRMGQLADSLLGANNQLVAQIFVDDFTADVLNEDPTLVAAYEENTVADWAPERPTLIYYCNGDEVVPPRNATQAADAMRSRGADSVFVEDGGNLTHFGCAVPAAVRAVEFFRARSRTFPTSLGRPVARPELRLSPNPVAGGTELTVTHLPGGDLRYELYDLSGRLTTRGLIPSGGRISLPADLRAGPHLIRIGLPDGTSVVRRIVIR